MFCFEQIGELKINFFQNSNFANVLIAGGREPQKDFVKKIAKNRHIFCADKAVNFCYKNKVVPECVLGDMDSCDKAALKWAEKHGSIIKKFDVNKDDTDFKLLLDLMMNVTVDNIICTGVWGGRFDHLYSIVQYLAAYQEQYKRLLMMADEREIMFFLNSFTSKACINFNKKFKNISILPLEKQSTVSIFNVKWPLQEAVVTIDNPYSISNELLKDKDVNISLKDGCVAVYLRM